jgi:hypothetical protein
MKLPIGRSAATRSSVRFLSGLFRFLPLVDFFQRIPIHFFLSALLSSKRFHGTEINKPGSAKTIANRHDKLLTMESPHD